MTNLVGLYQIADEDNIMVDCYALKYNPSISIMNSDGNCFIAIDPMQLLSDTDEKMKLAHELGHCETGAFYNINTSLQNRGQCEHRADVWAIKKLIPKDELNEAVKNGHNELWELAEYFDVPEPFVKKAIDYYNQGTLN